MLAALKLRPLEPWPVSGGLEEWRVFWKLMEVHLRGWLTGPRPSCRPGPLPLSEGAEVWRKANVSLRQ